jgi:hypothetical protein
MTDFRSQPAADGEVAELVADMRHFLWSFYLTQDFSMYPADHWSRRAPELLERLLAGPAAQSREPASVVDQPIPVSERLQQIEDLAADAMAGLRYIEHWHGRLSGVGWARLHEKAKRLNPAHALPLPSVEVE